MVVHGGDDRDWDRAVDGAADLAAQLEDWLGTGRGVKVEVTLPYPEGWTPDERADAMEAAERVVAETEGRPDDAG